MEEQVIVKDQRKELWYKVDNLLLLDYGTRIGVYGIAVYNVLALHANHETHEAYPSYQTIADMIGCSRRKVIQTMELLESLNIIRGQGRFSSKGSPMSNIWLLLDRSEWGDDEGNDDQLLHEVVNGVHYPSESGALPSERDALPSAPGAPKQESFNKTNLTRNPTTTTTRTHASDYDDGSDLDFGPIDDGFASISNAYQNEIGPLSPMISDGIKAELDDIRQILAEQPQGDETAEQWILYAIEQAVSSNARRWDYTRGVIKGIKGSKSLAAHKLTGSRKGQKSYASNSRRNKRDEAERNREINSKRGYYNPYTNETFDAQGNIVPQVQ